MTYKVDTKVLQDHKVGDRAACPLLHDMDGQLTNLAMALNALDNRVKVKKIPFTKSTSEKDTGWDLPAKAVVIDVLIEVTTAVSGASIDVGLLSSETGGDADGFVDGLSCATEGIFQPNVTVTAGSSEHYFSSCTKGVFLLEDFTAGSDNAGDVGTFAPRWYAATENTAKSVSYTTSNHDIEGYIHIVYMDLSQAGEL